MKSKESKFRQLIGKAGGLRLGILLRHSDTNKLICKTKLKYYDTSIQH
jgi:hypothetical protein